MDFPHPPVHHTAQRAADTPPAALAPVPRSAWGRVTLVGAGPGDAELLTLKAARVLASASLVLYDHLVSKDVLQHVPTGAELIYVGKQSSNHSLPQEGIIDLMVRLAQAGRSLVRLKGGDPYIFGRGGEEAEALAAVGIACETVPGISAAQGAAAATGIPLTHRDHAGMLVFATGHLQGEGEERSVALDWAARHPAGPAQHYRHAAKPACPERGTQGKPARVDHGGGNRFIAGAHRFFGDAGGLPLDGRLVGLFPRRVPPVGCDKGKQKFHELLGGRRRRRIAARIDLKRAPQLGLVQRAHLQLVQLHQ